MKYHVIVTRDGKEIVMPPVPRGEALRDMRWLAKMINYEDGWRLRGVEGKSYTLRRGTQLARVEIKKAVTA